MRAAIILTAILTLAVSSFALLSPAVAREYQCPDHDKVARLLREQLNERLLWQGNFFGDADASGGKGHRTLELWVGPHFRSWTVLEVMNGAACVRFVGSKWAAFPLALDRRD